MYKTLLTSLENGIFSITINRPDKLNALNTMVLDELNAAMDEVYIDVSIRSVIITGARPKACSTAARESCTLGGDEFELRKAGTAE